MRATHLALVVFSWLGSAGPTFAQPTTSAASPLVRFDLQGSVGWVNAAYPGFLPYDDWDHGVAQGAVGVGWYWTDHLKTEVEFQINSTSEFYAFEQTETIGRIPVYRASRYDIRSTGLGIGQVYQFRRNAWVHPFIGAGIDLRWESTEQEIQPVVVWDSSAGPRELEAGRRVGPTTAFKAQLFAVVGLKAYLCKRAFFRTDVRTGVHDGVEEVAARAGFGFDF
jgi:hypothetical protein